MAKEESIHERLKQKYSKGNTPMAEEEVSENEELLKNYANEFHEFLAMLKRKDEAKKAEKPRNKLTPNEITKILLDEFNVVCADDGNIYAEYLAKPGRIVEVREKYSTNPDYIFYLAHDICSENKLFAGRDTLSGGIEHFALAARRHHISNNLTEVPVYARWGYTQDDNCELTFYYDLANNDNQMVKITKNGPQIITKNLDVIFLNERHEKLPAPQLNLRGDIFAGSLDDLHEITNLDDTNFTLLKGAIFQLFSPNGPYLHTLFTGDLGAGKTTLARNIKSIIDNRKTLLIKIPKDADQFVRTVNNAQLPSFENVLSIAPALVDVFSAASTGDTGALMRKLYTDNETIRFNLHKGMMLSTSHNIIKEPELLERFLFIYFTRPLEGHFIGPSVLHNRANKIAPNVLGALFNGICESLSNLHQEKEYPTRMTDTLRWVDGAKDALGMFEDEFTAAYVNHRTSTLIELGADNVYVNVLNQFLLFVVPNFYHVDGYEATLEKLLASIGDGTIRIKDNQFMPSNYKAFEAGLKNNVAILLEYGIIYERDASSPRVPKLVLKFSEERIANLTPEELLEHEHGARRSLTIPLHDPIRIARR